MKKSGSEIARGRRRNIREHAERGAYPVMTERQIIKRGGRPQRPGGEVGVRDVVSGKKIGLGEARREKERILREMD